VVVISIAEISAVVAVTANGQMTSAPGSGLKTETVTDAAGNLHVPAAYRTTYESLGSWAVAGEQGQELKELHLWMVHERLRHARLGGAEVVARRAAHPNNQFRNGLLGPPQKPSSATVGGKSRLTRTIAS
jgi:hypothetical protein